MPGSPPSPAPDQCQMTYAPSAGSAGWRHKDITAGREVRQTAPRVFDHRINQAVEAGWAGIGPVGARTDLSGLGTNGEWSTRADGITLSVGYRLAAMGKGQTRREPETQSHGTGASGEVFSQPGR